MSACDFRSSMKFAGKRPRTLLLQFHDGDATAAPIAGCGGEVRHEWVRAQELGDGPAQLAGAEAVNETEAALFGHHRVVQELRGARQRLVDVAADDVQLRQAAL